MKTSFQFAGVIFLCCLFAPGANFISEPRPGGQTIFAVYEATTPCNGSLGNMLGMAPGFKCEMVKWNLTLYRKSNMESPVTFDLTCTYGSPKQGTRGFVEGTKTIKLTGKCNTGQGIPGNSKAVVYKLVAEGSGKTLSFFRPDQNLLHLLAADKSLMVGSAAWSYTLNRKDPVNTSKKKFVPKSTAQYKLRSGTTIVGIFEGRTPCFPTLNNLHGISSPNCNVIKCQLTLLQDSLTHVPSGFILYTIYVGFGDDNKYRTTGKWKLMEGTAVDPTAAVYQLEPEKSAQPIMLQKVDDNILFFLDSDARLLTGNEYCSFTLNRN